MGERNMSSKDGERGLLWRVTGTPSTATCVFFGCKCCQDSARKRRNSQLSAATYCNKKKYLPLQISSVFVYFFYLEKTFQVTLITLKWSAQPKAQL